MSHAKRKEKFKCKWGGGEFNALPRRFTRSHVFRHLSPIACKLFMDLEAQYNGFNNGDLAVAWSLMKPRGWKSKTTLAKAVRQLIDVDVLELTRPGNRRRCALYALTIYDIDECKGKHDAEATNRPPNTWLKHEPVVPLAESQAEFKAAQARRAA